MDALILGLILSCGSLSGLTIKESNEVKSKCIVNTVSCLAILDKRDKDIENKIIECAKKVK